MAERSIYSDIAKRTGGDLYLGVVGPVRTGKSTFISRFMSSAVLPNIEDENERARAMDEIPQSASGRTVMTTEPKFVPDEAVRVSFDGGATFNLKLIDCVGYMVDGALGESEEGEARMVNTPWSDEPIPFREAAEIGTARVIGEHSTICMLVTTDGSVLDIPRESYIPAEERVARELRECGKPFAVILNSREPESERAHALALELEEKYSAPVALVNCAELDGEDVREILSLVLGEFPIRRIDFDLPEWCDALPEEHEIRRAAEELVLSFTESVEKLGEVERALDGREDIKLISLDAGEGAIVCQLPIDKARYFEAIGELIGEDIRSDGELISAIMSLSDFKRRYARFEDAIDDLYESGYGILLPSLEELTLSEPELMRSEGGYGVRMSASADSVHLIRAPIKAEICPVVGSEEQSLELIRYLKEEMEEDGHAVFKCNMLGRTVYDLVRDGMTAKLSHIPAEARDRLGDTLSKIVNEGSNGLICILL